MKEKKIPHQILNAKHHEKEAEIIANAGKPGMVTIATNMAGRGTDIVLGGKKDDQDDHLWIENNEKVIASGGLHILGTERHESRRIDNQLRGRSGRQGDPGSSIFFISLQDELMRIFGGSSIDGMLKKLGLKENESIDHPWINKAMERAQQKVEARNFEIRKTLLKFDDVMNDQRQVIFGQRLKILKTEKVSEMIDSFLNEIKESGKTALENYKNNNDLKVFSKQIKTNFGNIFSEDQIKNFSNIINSRRLEGASTITQQVAKNFLLTSELSIERKIKEANLAFRIERAFTKDQILEFYINRIFFGSGIYGIEKASLSYFGKKAKDMSLSEGAMLAGIIRGPNRFSPFRNIEGANKERETVLRRMLDEGIITIDDYQNSMKNEVRVLKQKKL